jgi:hypothetical protein
MPRIAKAAADAWLMGQWITATVLHYTASAASAFGDLIVWPLAAITHLFTSDQ